MTNDQIVRYVAEKFQLRISDLKSNTRQHRIAHPRMLCFLLMHDVNKESSLYIGNYFSRGHATVLHGKKTISRDIDSKPAGLLSKTYWEIIDMCKNYKFIPKPKYFNRISEKYCNECRY